MARSNTSSAAAILLSRLYDSIPRPKPQNYKVRRLADRNQEIRARFAEGADTIELANNYGISRKRVYQILHGKRK
ncbi:MAG TPA: hypothetical protein VMT34_12490 [Aggregatilineales bacterium]|nr:hypothetical protein [Aggregatilineales bacterium]